MNANELMIGDWVNLNFDVDYKTGESIYVPVQVTGINKDGTVDVNFTYDKSESMQDGWDLKLIEPITLTPEILEKNGFAKDSGGEELYSIDFVSLIDVGYGFETFISNDEKGEFNGIKKYVHELQHALKLCGIEKEIVL